jgi:trans-L-3-hydroxyproline dehydratase
MVHVIKTIDAHVGGQPVRLIVDGVPAPSGRTSAQQRDWWRRQADRYRRSLIFEPRGHQDMTASLLTQPTTPGAHAGVVFMDAAGYPSMSGHSVIAATTIALERALIVTPGAADGEITLVLDTPAGTVQATARVETRGGQISVDSVAVTNVPAFVHAPSCPVALGTRELRVDIAYGGAFYAIVDTEAVGVPLTVRKLPELRRLGIEICESARKTLQPVHPLDASIAGIAGVIFTAPPTDPEAHLRNVTVKGSGSIDRSPGGTGTSAVMAVLDAMGLLPDSLPFVHEGLGGALMRGRALQRTQVGDHTALVTQIEGAAWITGEHTFLLDDDDPLAEGGF